MWRIHWPEGTISDFGNLTRTRDAAFAIAAHGRDWRLLRWRTTSKLTHDLRRARPSGQQAALQECRP
jgi:hypothetical protein